MSNCLNSPIFTHCAQASCLALSISFFIIGAALPIDAGAAVYKWTDENGNVYYSDKPPTVDAAEMDIESSSQSTAPTLSESERKRKQQRLLDAFEKERNDKKAAQAKAAEEKKLREAWCRRAKQELAEYRAAAHLYDYDEDGNKVVLSHEARAAAEQRYAADIKELC